MGESVTKVSQSIGLGVALAVGLIVSSFVISDAVKTIRQPTLSVTGAATQFVTSDKLVWHITVEKSDPTVDNAYTMLQKDLDTVKSYLVKHGVKDNELSTGTLNKTTYYVRDAKGYTTRQIHSYQLSQTIEVDSKRVAALDPVVKAATELLKEGLTVSFGSPQYFYTGLDDLKLDMIAKATENAKARAEKMASSAGNSVGPLTEANTGVFQITPPDSTEVSSWGINDTSSLEKKITAVVNVKFALR